MKSSIRVLSLVIAVLLLCSISSFAQRTQTKNAKQTRPASAGGDKGGASHASPSGKLVVGGSHAGLVGILDIHTDRSLEGWILITVVNQDKGIVKQDGEDLIELELKRSEDYTQKVELAPGKNSITVRNNVDGSAENLVRFDWVGVATKTEGQTKTEDTKSVPLGALGSPSGKLVVLGLHDNEKALIKIAVDSSLNGPLTISVEDETGKPLNDDGGKPLGKADIALPRNKNSLDEITVLLAKGKKNVVKVKSTLATEAAEIVELPPWELKAGESAEKKPFSFKPSDAKISTSGKLSAEATRVDGGIELRIQAAESVSGFTVDVLDKDNKAVSHEEYNDLPRGKNLWTGTFKAGEGANTVKVAAAGGDDKDRVELSVAAAEKLAPLAKDIGAFAPSANKSSADGKISAEATRTKEKTIQLRARIDNSIPGISIVVKDGDKNEVYNKKHELTRQLTGWWSLELPAGKGSNVVTITPIGTDAKDLALTVDEKERIAMLESDYLIPNSSVTRAIIGFEQIGASSSQGEGKPFFDLFLSAPLRFYPEDDEIARFSSWGNIRLSSTASQVATLGTIPANFINPLAEGGLTNKLVQSFDFLAGLEYRIFDSNKDWVDLIPGIKQRTTVSIVAGGGAISPLSSSKTDNVQVFAVPLATNPQRDLFVARYGATAASKKYIGFVFPDRDRFLRQYYGGFRFKTYYFDKGGKLINRFPALLDVMLGQNEAVTGGQFKSDVTDSQGKFIGRKRAYVLRLEAFYPFPVREANFLYLFGSAMLKIGAGGVKIDTPLILNRAGDEVRVTDDDVFIAPTLQSSRDLYRLGIGVNLIELFRRSRTSQ